MIIEWNAHLFSADTSRYPFHPRATYHPEAAWCSADPLVDYLATLDARGVDRAVLVHPEPYGDDHRLILDSLPRAPERLLGTALYYPDDPDGPAKLRDLVAQTPAIRAFRFHAHRGKEQYLNSFDDPGVMALWRTAAELGLIVELHIGPNYAEQAARRLQDFPDTPVLIDHLAEPQLGTAVEYAQVLELARFDRVYMKLSGLNHFAHDGPLYPSAKPFTQRVVAAFTPARMVWGSGIPEIVDEHLADCSETERNLVKGENLRVLLRWE